MRQILSTGRMTGRHALQQYVEAMVADAYRRGRRDGREEVFTARRDLVDRNEHACEDCVRDELGTIT